LARSAGERRRSHDPGRRSGAHAPDDVARRRDRDVDDVRPSSRRGSVEAPVRLDTNLRPGLAFMTFHFPDQVDVNILTIDATDPRSGTAEFKATAVRVEKLNGNGKEAAGVVSRAAGE
jgi:anaerobic selenocysteine-containing dehydrogenase